MQLIPLTVVIILRGNILRTINSFWMEIEIYLYVYTYVHTCKGNAEIDILAKEIKINLYQNSL